MSKPHHKSLLMVIVLVAIGITSGCAMTGDADPFQPVNRGFHTLNDGVDDVLVRPIAQTYVDYTPKSVRTGVSNFFDNVGYLNVILNDFLQGKFVQGFSDTGRFLINSTLGIGGLFDPATQMGFEKHNEDLGQTFGVWGLSEVAYLELPAFGPSSVRDAPGIPLSFYTNLLFHVGNPAVTIPLGIFGAIDKRSQLLDATRLRDESALDTYIFTREAYRQRRVHLLHDGDPPLEQFDDSEY